MGKTTALISDRLRAFYKIVASRLKNGADAAALWFSFLAPFWTRLAIASDSADARMKYCDAPGKTVATDFQVL